MFRVDAKGNPLKIFDKRHWEYDPNIKTFFWIRSTYDRMLDRRLENDDELVEWCAENNCETKGMTVTLPDEESITLFTLRWT